jgi:hypothetical protein
MIETIAYITEDDILVIFNCNLQILRDSCVGQTVIEINGDGLRIYFNKISGAF